MQREFIDNTGYAREADVVCLLGVARVELRVFTTEHYDMPNDGFEFAEQEGRIVAWSLFDGTVSQDVDIRTIDLSVRSVTTDDLRALCRSGWRLLPTGQRTWRARRFRSP